MGKVTKVANPKTLPQEIDNLKNTSCMVVGQYAANPAPPTKTSGIKMRGVGAATRGVMSRGPMA
jgi:hypothetical protein